MKKRGFGAGKWNGFGGKVSSNETVEEAAQRELFEEASIQAKHLEKVGLLDFVFQENPDLLKVHIFKCAEYTGKPVETEEMRPRWFDIDHIPFNNMWPDDKYWLPLLLSGKKFTGKFIFDKSDLILSHELSEL